MRRLLYYTVVISLLFAGTSCRLNTAPRRDTSEPEQAPEEVVEPEVAPREYPLCALLLSESNIEFTKGAGWSGGPENYRNLLAGLKEALARQGVEVDLVSETDAADGLLRHYRILFIVETYAITAEAEGGIRHFVQHGGVLVGVNEVGRFQGSWTKPWHYEDIFGVKALAIDEYGTAISGGQDLFIAADLSGEGLTHQLTTNFSEQIHFGDYSESLWVTQPTTARVLASFPSYVQNKGEGVGSVSLINDPVIAVSINDFGKGQGVWISPRMHDRDSEAWDETGDTLTLLGNCIGLARRDIEIPPLPIVTVLAISQIGYHPTAHKQAIIRVPKEDTAPFNSGTFEVRDTKTGDVIVNGELETQGPENPWRDYYYVADFSELKNEGAFEFQAILSGKRGNVTLTAAPFSISPDIWVEDVLPTQLSFLENYRCGLSCHTNDPIRGGYHDATGDYAVRMWSMPHVAYGLAECMLALTNRRSSESDRLSRELRWSINWLAQMIDSDGNVMLSVKPEGQWSPLDKRPSVDPTLRILEKGQKLNYQTTYIVGLAQAANALKSTSPDAARSALEPAVQAYDRIANHNWKSEATGEVGNFLWGSLLLYNATGDRRYLDAAKKLAPIILSRQNLDSARSEQGLRGDFFERDASKTFGNRQYKTFHAAGVYLGLLELLETLPQDDPLSISTRQALDIYFNEHLLRGSTLTLYGQKITALEPNGDGTFEIKFFTHPKSWVRLHGLNCDHLCLALAASKYARLTDRQDLREFAQAQADWVAGYNPLGYCMIDHLGWLNCPMIEDEKGTGRFKGGIANGIVGDSLDRPAWGVTWDSREYWLPHNAYLIALIPYLED